MKDRKHHHQMLHYYVVIYDLLISVSCLNRTTAHILNSGPYYSIPPVASFPSEQMWLTGPMIDDCHSPHWGSQIKGNLVNIEAYGDKKSISIYIVIHDKERK